MFTKYNFDRGQEYRKNFTISRIYFENSKKKPKPKQKRKQNVNIFIIIIMLIHKYYKF